MDFKTETQLRQEIDDAWRLVDQHKRAADIYAAERDHAKACYDRAVRILTGIHALLYPPRTTDNDGRTWRMTMENAPSNNEASSGTSALNAGLAGTEET